jgi:hypothetical protein
MMSLVMRSLFLVVLGSTAFTPLAAQESSASSDPRPAPPYLAPVPENCHWIVNLSYVSKSTPPVAPPPDSPVSIDTTRVGNMRRIIVKFVNGDTRQFDIVGHDCFAQDPPLGLQRRPLGTFEPYPYFDMGFPFTECVNPASFKGRVTYENTPAFHYQNDSSEAWISIATHLPIGADLVGSVKTTYQFLPTPSPDAVVLTLEEKRSLEYQKKAEDSFNGMR